MILNTNFVEIYKKYKIKAFQYKKNSLNCTIISNYGAMRSGNP